MTTVTNGPAPPPAERLSPAARASAMVSGIPLANKCMILFGAAVVLIIGAALIVPWVRLASIVDQSQLETSRQIARLWASNPLLDPTVSRLFHPGGEEPPEAGTGTRSLQIRFYSEGEWAAASFEGGFLGAAKERLSARADDAEDRERVEHAEVISESDARVYRYARAIVDDAGQRVGVLTVERRSEVAASQLFVNRIYLLAAGLGAGALAVLVFHLITTRLILEPVRSLRATADLVRQGNLDIRAELKTGDEFEDLGDAFNSMLVELTDQQSQLRGINRSLDLRLTDLAERNVMLHETARLKGEFLANISHELRTPLNSIIGFAEILQGIAESDSQSPGNPPTPEQLHKRRRYLDNIVVAGRTLLEMINELLTMARIDAGKVELHIQRMNVAETCEGLVALIRPLAEKKRLELALQLPTSDGRLTSNPSMADLPPIETDPQKLQQIVFNFLSNAVKFTPEGGKVTLRADRLFPADGTARVRFSVIDTGTGIPADKHEFIFQKFTQLDTSHTREHQGTGLGLAIAREYAEMLQGEILLDSGVGRGSMFSLVVPLRMDPTVAAQQAIANAGRTLFARATDHPAASAGVVNGPGASRHARDGG